MAGASKEMDHERLFRYVEAFFARAKRTTWPTVRRAARALHWSQERIMAAIDGDPTSRLFTSSYFTRPEPPQGEHFIESFGEE